MTDSLHAPNRIHSYLGTSGPTVDGHSDSQIQREYLSEKTAFLRPISKLGPDAVGVLAALRVFYEIAREFSRGHTSLSAVAKSLEARQLSGRYPESMPTSKASVHRYMSDVERFFGKHFGLQKPAELLVRNGEGKSFSGLTSVGNDAWRLTTRFLRDLGMLEEEN